MGLLSLVRKLPNQTDTIAESVEKTVAPTAGDKGSRFLIHSLVGFGEKTEPLAGRRSGEFFNGDVKDDITCGLVLHEREVVKLSQLLGGVLLNVRPIGHRETPDLKRRETLCGTAS